MSALPVAGAAAPFPLRTLRIGIFAMILLMLASIVLTWRVGEQIREEMRAQVDVITAAEKIDHYGTVLELSIKAVVANGDTEAAARYRSVQPVLREILSDLRHELQTSYHQAAIESVDQADLALIAIEYQALDLAGRGKLENARKLIHSPRYDYLADVYAKGIRSIEKQAAEFVAERRQRLDLYLWAILSLSAVSLVLIILGWFAFVRPIRRWGAEVEVARAAAEQSAAQLQEKQNELEDLNQRLFRQARVDPLTGLATRLSFNEDASKWVLTDIAPHVYCAATCDIDYFKQFNDNKGHLAGDQALQLVAEALRSALGPDDQAYRLGGEEFLVVMKVASARAAMARAERIRQAVAELGIAHPVSPTGAITLSIGVSALDRSSGMTVERWLGTADEALYAAKSGGRDRVALAPGGAAVLRSVAAQRMA